MSSDIQLNNNYICDICRKEFSTKFSLQRHNETINCKEKIEAKFCKICDKVFADKQGLQRHLKTKKHIQNVSNKIKNINNGDKNNIINVTGTNNGTINGTNNGTINGTNKTIINIINIIPHLEETLNDLSEKEKINILKKHDRALPELIKKINFNKDLPQNHNVFLTGKQSKDGHIYDGNKWIAKSTKDIINDLIELNINNIDHLLVIHKEKLLTHIIQKIENMIDKLEYDSQFDGPDKDKKQFKKKNNG